MSLVATEAVVLHAFDYLESSRIVRLATRDHGVQSVLARGARRARSNFGAGLDLFAQGTAHLQLRPGRDLHTLTGFDLTHPHSLLATDLERFSAASALAELALRFYQEDAHAEHFEMLTTALAALASAPVDHVRDVGIGSAWRIVAGLGFSPTIDHCCVCHAGIAPDEERPFSHASGGVVCERCERAAPLNRTLPSAARDALRRWLGGEAPAPMRDVERRAHFRLLREFVCHHLSDDRELRAFDMWERGILKTARGGASA